MGTWKIRFAIRLGKPSVWRIGVVTPVDTWQFINPHHSTPVAAGNKMLLFFPSTVRQIIGLFFFFPSSHPSVSGLDLILCCTQHESVNSAAEGVCYLPETSDLCSLSPAALHLPARCGCSFLCRHSLQYFKLICCCSRKKKTTAVLSCHVSLPVKCMK